MRVILSIAGSDPSGGAGIQADLRTFAAHGLFGTSAITAVTAQNTMGVSDIHALPPAIVAAQIDAVAADFDLAATKIGMLANAAIVEAVADAIIRWKLRSVVLDPVVSATRGGRLLDDDGVSRLIMRLLPLVHVITPNLAEAEILTGLPVTTMDEMRQAARAIIDRGARAVVITGGHLPGPPIDLLIENDREIELVGERLDVTHTHGTGCTFASALASGLANGNTVEAATRAAKAYVVRAMQRAPGLGHGRGPLGIG